MLYEVITEEVAPPGLVGRVEAEQGERSRADVDLAGHGGVITSYSIHYTKLYDVFTGEPAQADQLPAAVTAH